MLRIQSLLKQHGEETTPSRSAFTLLELLTVIAVVGILATLLISAVGYVRTAALQTENVATLRNLGMASILYAQEHDGMMPIFSYKDGSRLKTTRNTLTLAGGPNLLLSPQWEGGNGSIDYLPSPDAYYGPFTPEFHAGRSQQSFYRDNGKVTMGYVLYSLPGDTDINEREPFSNNIANDRIGVESVHPQTPVYSDIIGNNYGSAFTGPRFTVFYLNGSIGTFDKAKVINEGVTKRIRIMAGLAR